MTNQEIADYFRQLAEIMTLQGENVFKVRAYRRAAEVIAGYPRSIADLREEGDLTEIEGIGSAISAKIGEILDTGRLSLLDRLEAEIPAGVATLMRVPEIGPKSALAIYETLGIDSLDGLLAAAQDGRLERVKGIGPSTARRILAGVEALQRRSDRLLLGDVLPRAEALLAVLVETLGEWLLRHSLAGSLRRGLPLVGDINLLVAAPPARMSGVLESFSTLPQVAGVLAQEADSTAVRLHSGERATLRVVDPADWGTALILATGSAAHTHRLHDLAAARGASVSGEGLLDAGGRRLAFAEEAALYDFLGLAWIPPMLREHESEIAAARAGELPALLPLDALRGDLHMHSTWSDGKASILEMGQAARARGYEYIAITDHSHGLAMVGGLSPERLIEQRYEIINANAKLGDFRILQGAEVEIRTDGSLDYPDDVLAQLDIVVASMHTGIRGSRETNTQRLLGAIHNPHVHVIGHLTNRLLGRREGAELDMAAILQAAAETGTILEINANPWRLDLDAHHARTALEMGCLLAINSDAHSPGGLDVMRYGVLQAQRAWAEAEDVINTRSLDELLGYLG